MLREYAAGIHLDTIDTDKEQVVSNAYLNVIENDQDILVAEKDILDVIMMCHGDRSTKHMGFSV